MILKRLAGSTAAVCLVAASQLVAHATLGGQANADQRNGIYLEQGEGASNQLIAQMAAPEVQGLGTSMMTMGFKKPHMVTKLREDKSEIRTSPSPSFLFVFGKQANASEMLNNPSQMQTAMSGIPQNASSPKDFSLIRLTLDEGLRVFDSGKVQQAKFAFDKVEPRVYRVHPSAPLEAGEYGFAVIQGGAAAQIWDFGVDAAK